jgi:hypothetical protein
LPLETRPSSEETSTVPLHPSAATYGRHGHEQRRDRVASLKRGAVGPRPNQPYRPWVLRHPPMTRGADVWVLVVR